ncbi:MAG: NAD(P)-dependent alcohol dehydrogenase [Thermoleophilia bacterium]|nr:NAD(P)-dependent alcohol dehydrogenase [Thermoleophilia bacterium]
MNAPVGSGVFYGSSNEGEYMRAVVHSRYGPPGVLRIEEVNRPTPKDDEVLVRVHATTVNRTDCGFRKAKPFIVRLFSGILRPKRQILGSELAGEIEAVGAAVTQFARGDRVFGVNADVFGTHAEFVCVQEDAPLAKMPAGMPFDEAAAVCDGAILALTYLRRADLRQGQKILIYGASGSIGTAGVQLAKHIGADVTAVCNTKNIETVRSLGADEVVDYTEEDFTKNGETYDVIFDAVTKTSFGHCRGSLKQGGIFMGTDLGFLGQNPLLALLPRIGTKRVAFPLPRYTKKDVLFLKGLIESGDYRAVIDRRYPLEHVVDATKYVETEQKTGNVVLTVSHNDTGPPPPTGEPAS